MIRYYIYAVSRSCRSKNDIEAFYCKDSKKNMCQFNLEQLITKINETDKYIFYMTKQNIHYQIYMDKKLDLLKVSSHDFRDGLSELLSLPEKQENL